MIQGGFHVDRVPEHHRIGDHAKRAELVFLILAIRLSDFAAPAVADGPDHPMTALAPVELCEDTPTIGRVVDIVEQVDGLVGRSQFHDRACQAGGTFASQKRAHQFRGLYGAELSATSRSNDCHGPGPSARSVVCGRHAFDLVEALARKVEELRSGGPRWLNHLFIAAPNTLTFFAGQRQVAIGPTRLYEFDFEGGRDGSYRASLTLPIKHSSSLSVQRVGSEGEELS